MKKTLILLGVAALAVFASCKKEDTLQDSLTLVSAPTEVIPVEGTEEPLTIVFKATKAWTASVNAEAAEYVSLTPTSGAAGDNAKVKFTVSANEVNEDRTIIVTIKSEGIEPLKVTLTQASPAHFFVTPEGPVEVTKDGGEFTLSINTNCEFTMKDYSDGSFPWQHAVLSEDKKTVTVTIDANNSYNARESYIKFTIPSLSDSEENELVVRVYCEQDCLPSIKYSISMYSAEFDTWGTTVLSEAIYNGKHYVSNGQDLYEIDPSDGAYKKIDWPWGSGMTQKVITNDDAGNLIVCNHTAYTDAYLDGYFILNVVTPAGEEKNLITKAAWECGGPFGAKLKVRGDITSNALIVAPVEGIVDVTMSMTVGYWEVEGGVAGDYTQLTASGFVGTWGAGAWNTYPNNFPTIIAKGVTASEGFVMSGCYEENAVYAVDGTTGACYKMLTPELWVGEYDLNGNLGCQSMSMGVVGGKTYLAILASPFFPSYGPGWSGAPYLSILEVPATLPATPLNMWEDANLVKICTTYFPWEDDPATDWAISVAADVNLFDANGKIGVNIVDLNGRSIESYEFDPAVISK